MLREIRIRSLGVIEDALLEFGPGLNVVTGETGAGKTMVVQGLGLLLGGRADAALVRHGASRASIDGLAELPVGHPAVLRAQEAGGDTDDGLILARTVAAEGRSRAVVGGRTAPASVLADIAEHLVAVHGQADQWRLQRPEQHRVMLDGFGAATIGPAAQAYRSVFEEWQEVSRELRELTEHARERAQRLDMLTAGLEEIERVDPQPGEDVALAEEIERLQHADSLRDGAAGAHQLLVGEDDLDFGTPALDLVSRARQGLAAAADHDSALAGIAARLREVEVLVAEAATDLAGYLADLDADPGRLAAALDRKAALTALTRKYGESIDEVLQWGRDSAAEVDGLSGSDERISELRIRHAELQDRLSAAADLLSQARIEAAERLQARTADELTQLAMGSAQVVVEVRRRAGEYAAHGQDEVEILMAANRGTAPRPVNKAASGGELSRLMLALEVVSGSGDVPTFVFDEVDAGVGGAAALAVGSRLKELSRHAQVIVVTHLAQVAAYADRQLVVHKRDDGQITRSDVLAVEGADRVAEIARMLGGDSDGQEALAHAAALLEQVSAQPVPTKAPGRSRTTRAAAGARHTSGSGRGRQRNRSDLAR